MGGAGGGIVGMGGDGLLLSSQSLGQALEKSSVNGLFTVLLLEIFKLVHVSLGIGSSFLNGILGAGGLGGLARIIVGIDVTKGLEAVRLEGTLFATQLELIGEKGHVPAAP